MHGDYAIEVINVNKKFKVYYDKASSLKDKILFRSRNRYEERQVLNGISFNLKKGEAVGLVGKNGCGKSTTLKLLTRIMYPDEGIIKINGRVSSLIELGAGFHHDMSGRENIYTNASIFGLTRKEIDDRLDEIISFSELEEFIDNPVRTYSSGMYMRLAFSVAISVNADVLLIDEILGVGDVNFQTKCFEKLKEIKSRGTTIVIVSHSLGQIEQICERSIWIENGLIREEGIPWQVHENYLSSMEEQRLEKVRDDYNKKPLTKSKLPDGCCNKASRNGDLKVKITSIKILNENKKEDIIFKTGSSLYIQIEYKCDISLLNGYVGFKILRDDGLCCYTTDTKIENMGEIEFKETGQIIIRLNNTLLSGKYYIDIILQNKEYESYDHIANALEFQVFSETRDKGVMRISHNWIIDGHFIEKEGIS